MTLLPTWSMRTSPPASSQANAQQSPRPSGSLRKIALTPQKRSNIWTPSCAVSRGARDARACSHAAR